MTQSDLEKIPNSFPTNYRNGDKEMIGRAYDWHLGIVKSMRFWQKVSIILAMILGLSVAINFYIFKRQPLVPYIVTVTSQGEVLDLGEVQYHRTNPTEAQLSYFLIRAIKNLREVPESYDRFNASMEELSHFTSKPVLNKIWNIDLKERENILRSNERRFIDVKNIIRLKNQPAFLCKWIETTYNTEGRVKDVKAYQATISVSLKDVTNRETLRTNPLGLYIEDMSTDLDDIRQ